MWQTRRRGRRTSTSPGPGPASSTSCTASGDPDSSRTAARIRGGRSLCWAPWRDARRPRPRRRRAPGADRRRARRRLRGPDRGRPARVPAQVPQDGRRPVRLLPRQRAACSTPTSPASRTAGPTSARAASGSRATCTPRTTAPTWTPQGSSSSTSTTSTRPTSGTSPGTSSGWPRASRCSASPRRSPTTTIREMIAHLRGRLPRAGARVRAPATATTSSGSRSRTPRARCTTCCSRRGSRRGIGPARARRRRSRATSGASATGPGVRRLDDDERDEVREAYEALPRHDPRGQAPAQRLLRGQGRRRARRLRDRQRRPAGLQPAHRGPHAGARERRRALDEAGQRRRAEPRRRRRARSASYFEHQGHRTAVSQRALQAHADPWLGWCELRGEGQVVAGALALRGRPRLGRASPSPTRSSRCCATSARRRRRSTASPTPGSRPGARRLPDRGGDRRGRRRRGRGVRRTTSPSFGAAYGELARDDHRRFVDAFRNGAIPGLEA